MFGNTVDFIEVILYFLFSIFGRCFFENIEEVDLNIYIFMKFMSLPNALFEFEIFIGLM